MFLKRSVRCRYGALVEGSLFSLPAESLGLASVTFYHEGGGRTPKVSEEGCENSGNFGLDGALFGLKREKGLIFPAS